jgi:hypothetical protein
MNVPSSELLMALKAPNSGWLAAVLTMLDDAFNDPGFTHRQRELVMRVLAGGELPTSVRIAASARLEQCEFLEATAHNADASWESALGAPALNAELARLGSAAA